MGKTLDYKEFEKLIKQYEKVRDDFDTFLREFLLEMAMITLARTKQLTPVDTGNLRERWEISDVYLDGNDLCVAIINPVEYASFVEDGHRQHKRFLPGEWVGDKFNYIPNSDSGIMLQEKFIPGFHMARISINKIQNEIPKRFYKKFKVYLQGLEAT